MNKIPILSSIVLIAACASFELLSDENNPEQENRSGSIIGAIGSPPSSSGISGCKLLLEGEGIRDSITKGKEEMVKFQFDNLTSGNYKIILHDNKSGYDKAIIDRIAVSRDSISYVGILSDDIHWKGVKIHKSDTSLTGALAGNISLHKGDDYVHRKYLDSDENEIDHISVILLDRLNQKSYQYFLPSLDTFHITDMPVSLYTIYVKIDKEDAQPIRSAYVYNVIIKPNNTALVDFTHFMYPNDIAYSQFINSMPYFDWTPRYK